MPKAVGIDIGTGNLKICEVDGTARKYRVTKFIEAEFDRGESVVDEMEEIGDVLRTLFAEHKIKRDQVVVSVGSQDCIVRDITVPFTGDEQVRKVIRFEAESHLHSRSLEEVVVDFHKTGESGTRSEVLIFAAVKDALRQRLETLDDAGVDPVLIDHESLALYNTVLSAGLLEPDKVQVVLDIGSRKTNLIITSGSDLMLVRSIRIGTEGVLEGIPGPGEAAAAVEPGEEAEVTAPEGDWVVVEDAAIVAEAQEEAAAEPAPSSDAPSNDAAAEGEGDAEGESEQSPMAAVPTPMGQPDFPFLHRVLVEVNRSLVRIRSPHSLGRVLITGGGSLIEGLPAALEDGLQVPVEWIDLRETVNHTLDDEEADNLSSFGTVAMGLALKQLGSDPIGVNFRQDEFRYQKAFDQVKIVVSCCVCLVAIRLLVVLAFVLDRKTEARIPWQVVVTRARELGEEVLDPIRDRSFDTEAVKRVVGSVQRKNRAYEGAFGGGGSFPPLTSAFEVWNEISRAMLRDKAKLKGMKIADMSIVQGGVTIRGSVPEPQMIEAFRESLLRGNGELFTAIEPGSTLPEDGAHTFNNFKIKLPGAK